MDSVFAILALAAVLTYLWKVNGHWAKSLLGNRTAS